MFTARFTLQLQRQCLLLCFQPLVDSSGGKTTRGRVSSTTYCILLSAFVEKIKLFGLNAPELSDSRDTLKLLSRYVRICTVEKGPAVDLLGRSEVVVRFLTCPNRRGNSGQ